MASKRRLVPSPIQFSRLNDVPPNRSATVSFGLRTLSTVTLQSKSHAIWNTAAAPINAKEIGGSTTRNARTSARNLQHERERRDIWQLTAHAAQNSNESSKVLSPSGRARYGSGRTKAPKPKVSLQRLGLQHALPVVQMQASAIPGALRLMSDHFGQGKPWSARLGLP